MLQHRDTSDAKDGYLDEWKKGGTLRIEKNTERTGRCPPWCLGESETSRDNWHAAKKV